MKRLNLFAIALCLSMLAISCDSFSPVGTYRVDLTVAQSGTYTTIVLKPDGSALERQDGSSEVYHTYWDDGYGKGIIRYGSTSAPYIMDFNTWTMYYGWDAYRSRDPRNAYKFSRK